MKFCNLLIVIILLFLPSCTGGSSSSGSSSSSASEATDNSLFANFSDTEISATCATTVCAASNFETTEYFTRYSYTENSTTLNTQNFLDIINAADAYAYLSNREKNWAGDGVDVVVSDTGIVMNHSDLQANYSPNSDTNSLLDDDGHGTHVAGIIAADKNDSGMHGVAPNANLLSVALDDLVDNQYGSSDYYNFVKDSGAKIVNMSWGYPTTIPSSQIDDIKTNISTMVSGNSDLVLVVAAGNEGASQPSYPAYLANDSVANQQMIVVAAYDGANYEIADFSNRCGAAKDYCLLAPGVSIYSTSNDSDNSYAIMSGTSMAAPVVSGAAAILKSAWPSLTGAQIVDILLTTADQLSSYTSNINTVTGHGLLNLDSAVQSQGSSTTSLGSSQYLYDNSELYIPQEYQSLFATAEFSDFVSKGVFFDSYNRDYTANYLDKITFLNSDSANYSYGNNLINNKYNFENINFSDGGLNINLYKKTNLLAKHIFIEPDTQEIDSDFDNLHYSFSHKKIAFNIAAGEVENKNLFNDNLFKNLNILTKDNSANYFNSAHDMKGINFNALLHNNKEYSLNLGFIAKENNISKKGFAGFSSELFKNSKNSKHALKYQYIIEENSAQGISGNEAFNIGKNYQTNIIELSSSYEFNNINYFLKYGFMETLNKKQENSFVNLSDKFYSDSFSLGAVQKIKKDFQIGFILSKPWQIRKGDLAYTIPVGLSDDGEILTDTYKVDFDQQLQLDYEFFLNKQISYNKSLKFNLIFHQDKLYEQENKETEIFMFYDYFF